MIKFVAALDQGQLFGFGLTESNLNRLEFNSEPIFFDFGYMGHPELFGVILYFDEFETPEDVLFNINKIGQYCVPFLNADRGVTTDTLRVFPIAKVIMSKFRSTPFWGFETQVEIVSPQDKQLFFAGRTEQDIEKHLEDCGFISPQTKRTYKGFGKR